MWVAEVSRVSYLHTLGFQLHSGGTPSTHCTLTSFVLNQSYTLSISGLKYLALQHQESFNLSPVEDYG